jgi:hypothetical protein
MKTITKSEYTRLVHLKELIDVLGKAQEDYYQESVKILDCTDDNGWMVDYFFNDNMDINKLFEVLNVSVEE